MSIKEGARAPAFELADATGRVHTLQSLQGRHAVLFFYPKDDTPGCTAEACAFRDLWSEYATLDVAVLGVSPDGAGSHRSFSEKYQLPFPLLSDPDRRMLTAYGAYGEKIMYGRRTEGVIRSTVWIDPEGIVHRHWARVTRAATHPHKVLEALQAGLG